LRISLSLNLAVLDSKQWRKVEHQLPYSMRSVTGEPPTALMAANLDQPFDFFPKSESLDPGLLKSTAAHVPSIIATVYVAFEAAQSQSWTNLATQVLSSMR